MSKVLCFACGLAQVDFNDDAKVPGLEHLKRALGREPREDDLANFVIGRECANDCAESNVRLHAVAAQVQLIRRLTWAEMVERDRRERVTRNLALLLKPATKSSTPAPIAPRNALFEPRLPRGESARRNGARRMA